jgi:uncharacterized membrane protein YphA (DoxX/SURF4 family)
VPALNPLTKRTLLTMIQPQTQPSALTSLPSPWHVGIFLLALSLATLGVISLVTGDFAFQWQPVPADFPARMVWARAVGAVEIIASVAILIPRTASLGSVAITAIFWVWLLVLHLPRVLHGEVAAWIGACELLALAGASLALNGVIRANQSSLEGGRSWRLSPLIGKLCFGFALLPLGLSHFIYAGPAASLIPAWFPAPLFFTYLTGVGHISAGLSLLTGVLARIAAPLLTFMFACFIIFLHIPRVIATPTRYEFTTLVVSLALSGAAWIIAGVVSANIKRADS